MTPTTDEEPAEAMDLPTAVKPPSHFCHACTALLCCTLSGILGVGSLVIALTTFPFYREPILAVLAGVQIAFAVVGIVGASAVLCCTTHSWTRVLLLLCATAFVTVAVAMAPYCMSICAFAVRADARDWLAFFDDSGHAWRYADKCSGDRYHFSPLPIFLFDATGAVISAAACLKLVARLRRIDRFSPTASAAEHQRAGSAAPLASLTLLTLVATAALSVTLLIILDTNAASFRWEPAPAPPPRPPNLPPAPRFPPPTPRPPRGLWFGAGAGPDAGSWGGYSGGYAGGFPPSPSPPPPGGLQAAGVRADFYQKSGPPSSFGVSSFGGGPPSAAPAPPPPTPVYPEGASPFKIASGPCKAVGRCITSSNYVPCVDRNVCVGPSCVGPPCPGPPPPRPTFKEAIASYDDEPSSYSYDGTYDGRSDPIPEMYRKDGPPLRVSEVDPDYHLLEVARFDSRGYADNEFCNIHIEEQVTDAPATLAISPACTRVSSRMHVS